MLLNGTEELNNFIAEDEELYISAIEDRILWRK